MLNLGASRSGVVRPRNACASPMGDFLAERNCCGTFSSDDARAITLPLCAGRSELHLIPQPLNIAWLRREAAEKRSLRRGGTRDRDVAVDLIPGLRGRERRKHWRYLHAAARLLQTVAHHVRPHCCFHIKSASVFLFILREKCNNLLNSALE